MTCVGMRVVVCGYVAMVFVNSLGMGIMACVDFCVIM